MSADARVARTLPPCSAMRAKMAATCAEFCRGKNYFRHAGAERTMVIELGEAQVFKRQIAKAVERRRSRWFACRVLR